MKRNLGLKEYIRVCPKCKDTQITIKDPWGDQVGYEPCRCEFRKNFLFGLGYLGVLVGLMFWWCR